MEEDINMPNGDFFYRGRDKFAGYDKGGGDVFGDSDVPSNIEIAQMSPEELAEYFGEDVEGFDLEEFMRRFGKFITPFDETKINLMEEDFQLDTGFLSGRTAFGLGGIRSNMTLSAGAEKQRALVMGEYTTKMGELGLGLKSDIFGEYERQAEERLDYFRQLAGEEVFTEDYWKEFQEDKAEKTGVFGLIGGLFGGDLGLGGLLIGGTSGTIGG